jgi:hypothetical protein
MVRPLSANWTCPAGAGRGRHEGMKRRWKQVDVFGSRPFAGNPGSRPDRARSPGATAGQGIVVTMDFRIALGAGLAVGCAHGPSGMLAADIEAAYLSARARQVACPANDGACCAQQVQAARAAAARGDGVSEARLWHQVAVDCPARRAEATAAVMASRAAARAPARGSAAPTTRLLNVSYRARLSPAVRLYWVAAAVGTRLLPSAAGGAAGGSHSLQVEVHAIRFDGRRAGPLLVAERRFEVPADPDAQITVEIAEGDPRSPLALDAQVTRPPPVRRGPPPAAPARSSAPPILERSFPVRLDPLRAPAEFAAAGAAPAMRICLDRHGDVETVRFLEAAHPRLAASLLDRYRDSQHQPYRVNDRPVPSCEVINPSAPAKTAPARAG